MKAYKYLSQISDNSGLKKVFIKNFFRFLPVLLVPLIIFFNTLVIFVAINNEKELMTMNENITKRVAEACDSVLNEIEYYVINASVDKDIEHFIIQDTPNDEITRNIQKYLKFYKTINSYINSISVYNCSTGQYISENRYDTDTRYPESVNVNPEGLEDKKTSIVQYAKNGSFPYIIQMTRLISIKDKTGFVSVEILFHEFDNLLSSENYTDGSEIFILDNNRNIIYSGNIYDNFNKNLSSYMEEHPDKIITSSGEKSQYYDLEYISIGNKESSSFIKKIYMLFIVLASLTAIILSIFIAFYLAKKSVSPIVDILKASKNKNNLSENSTDDVPLEIKYIMDDITDSKTDMNFILSVRMFLLKQLNIQALEAQINPHFIYNTLDSISWLAFSELGKNNSVSNSVNDLSKLFKLSLNSSSYVVTLEEELNHIKIYERIIKRRYGENIVFHYNINDTCLSCHCVKFALQPIVENSVNHGIKPNGGKGNIYISSDKSDDDFWILTISDDGVGISEELEKNLNTSFSIPNDFSEDIEDMLETYKSENGNFLEPSHHKGIGMKNVNQRIQLIFGNNCGLQVTPSPNGGTTVTIIQKTYIL